MRARVAKKDILPAAMRMASIADRKSVAPILSHVLVDFCGDGLRMKATDLDHSVIDMVPAEVSTFGAVAVPAVTLCDIIRKSPDNAFLEFSLADKGNRIIIVAGKSKFDLSVMDAVDFPEIKTLSSENKFSVKSIDLSKLINKTKFSISPEENRPNLSGIYFYREESKLKAVSTDGHRLSLAQIDVQATENLPGVIVAKKTIFEVKKMLDVYGGDIFLIFDTNQVQFEIGESILVSKLIDAQFPDYKRVIPETSPDFFTVKRQDFLEIIDRVSILADDKIKTVKLELNKNILFFHSASAKIGSGKDEVEVVCSGGFNWNAGFNATYLMDIAGALDCETLKVYVKESRSSILIIDDSEPKSLFVVMPLRI